MSLKKVDQITVVGAILALLSLGCAYAGFLPGLTVVFGWIGIVILFVTLIFHLRHNRCPKCGVYLWRKVDFCSCGEHLEKYR